MLTQTIQRARDLHARTMLANGQHTLQRMRATRCAARTAALLTTFVAGSLAQATGAFAAQSLQQTQRPSPAAAVAPSRVASTDEAVARLLANPHPSAARVNVVARLAAGSGAAQETRLKGLGACINRRFAFIYSVALTISVRDLARLVRLPFVQHVSSDAAIMKLDDFTVGSSLASAACAQFGVSGNGVGVAVLDSGVNTLQPDLWNGSPFSSRILANVSFVPDGNGANDLCGHGTHVAGIVAGNGLMSSGALFTHTFYGIARRANIINVRVLDGTGQSTVSTVIAGIQWVVANAKTYNIRVMNVSLGHPVGESYRVDPLCQAVEAAWKSGIVVVCAAGNGGRLNAASAPGVDNEGWGTAWGSIQSPANDPYVLTVGAMKSIDGSRADDRVATYSARGPSRLDLVMKPDIVAPGNQVISLESYNSYLVGAFSGTNLVPWQYYCRIPLPGSSLSYFRLSGTSMAAPVAAGAAALMLERDPTLSPDTVKARLMITADKWADPSGHYNPCTYGAGYIDIVAALQCPATAHGSAASPALWQDASGSVHVGIGNILWGNNVIWGLDGVPTDQPTDEIIIWGNGLLSGTDVLSASNIIWGLGVWSDSRVWDTSTGGADLSSVAIYGE